MAKTILMTGSTSGIGLEAAKSLAASGHRVLLHGRSEAKLAQAAAEVQKSSGSGDSGSQVGTYTP